MSTVTPQHQTILLRHSIHTVLISLLPTAPISSIKTDLLNALSSRNITELASVPVPSPDEVDKVELGIMNDRKDYRKGFRLLLEGDPLAGLDGEDEKKGKGKGKKAASMTNNTVAGVGLREGDVVAFRFKTEIADKGEDEDEEMLEGLDNIDEGTWDVVWPSYEDEE